MAASGENPVSEFTQESLLTKAFPTLFPSGAGDLTSRRYRLHSTPSISDIVAYSTQFVDGRLPSHPEFRSFMLFKMAKRTYSELSYSFSQNRSWSQRSDVWRIGKRNSRTIDKTIGAIHIISREKQLLEASETMRVGVNNRQHCSFANLFRHFLSHRC